MQTIIDPCIDPCPCGARPPTVGVIRRRGTPRSQTFVVGCIRCGRVGQFAGSPGKAIENWNQDKLYYQKEDN